MSIVKIDTSAVRRFFKKLTKQTRSFKPEINFISSLWLKRVKYQFRTGNQKGVFRDLRPSTKLQKLRKYKRVYPMLVATGDLRDAVTNKTSIKLAKNRLIAKIPRKVSYGKFHLTGTSDMARRDFFFISDSHFNKAGKSVKLFPNRALDVIYRSVKKKIKKIRV